MNPLLSSPSTPFNTPPFKDIQNDHFLPAVKALVAAAKNEVNSIVANSDTANFSNTIEALEKSGKLLDRTASIFFNLNSAETSDEI